MNFIDADKAASNSWDVIVVGSGMGSLFFLEKYLEERPDDRVLIVDFKTSRRPPEAIGQVPRAIVRQMAAYCAALEKAFPGRRIEAALLYTAAPRLIALPADLIDSHKPGLT